MVMEYYPSWFDCDGIQPHNTLDPYIFSRAVNSVLENENSSLNIYPIFGGTNFGFSSSGQHPDTIGPYTIQGYCSVTTSYDFDAPISESGDPTPKFFVLCDLLSKYGGDNTTIVPPSSPKGNYGSLQINRFSSLLENITLFNSVISPQPLTMEVLGYGFGYIFIQQN